ncbi:MAG: sulfotransferase family 2 domain-containing protein [Pseudomonadota bacterium]
MPSLTLSDRLIWFAHCPKAGGTSLEQLMVATWGPAVGHLHWGWDRWWRKGGWRVADPPNSPQHLVWADATARLPRSPDVVFALVRDPVARMASEHRWQRRHRRGTRLGKLLAHLPFSLWLRLMLQVAQRHPHAFDNHLRPQADFVPETARVFRLEDGLAPAVRWLSEATGTALDTGEIPHALPSGRGAEMVRADQALIARAFAADYARFGYALPDMSPRVGVADALAALLAPPVAWLDRRGAL